MKIAFLIRTLTYGGAERQLVALARGLHARGHRVSVAVFYPGGPLEAELRADGIPVLSAAKRGRYDALGFCWRLGRLLRAEEPEIVHGYLGASNSLSLFLRPLHGGKSVWGVRASDIEVARSDWMKRLDAFVECRLARFAALIIANSLAGQKHVVRLGFPATKTAVIPNGIDTQRFRPDPAGRAAVRAEWGVPHDRVLIGRVGRMDPQKDYPGFLRAAALVAGARPDATFVCVGAGPDERVAGLRALAAELGLADRVIWAGTRGDMPAVYSALDLCVSSSAFGEGTPNVLAEAMACGVPSVATDVGDSALVVGPHGAIVPPNSPTQLAAAILAMLDRVASGGFDPAAGRAHIVRTYSLAALIERTETALHALLADPSQAAAREPQEMRA